MMQGQRPIILGIVGDSAAGKTTLNGGLAKLLGEERVTSICTDDYHKYDRHERAAHNITALHPDCNYVDVMELHLERLHYGQPILKPVYDHSNGALVRPEYVKARDFVIVEGLLGYHTPVMRQFYDVKVFLNPPEPLRHFWKVKRDTAKRSYTREQVLDELVKREPDARDFIRPQRECADIVVEFHPDEGADGVQSEKANGHLNARLILRPTIHHPDLSYLFEDEGNSSGIRMTLGRDSGKPVDILEIDGSVTPDHAAKLMETIWQHLPGEHPLPADQFGEYQDQGVAKHSDPLAITQLLLTYHLLREYRDSGSGEQIFARPVAAESRLRKRQPAIEKEEV